MHRLIDIFPTPNDLLHLEPEELGGVLIEVIPAISQNQMFGVQDFLAQFYQIQGNGYPPFSKSPVSLAIAEALSWLLVQGIIVEDPSQHAVWYRLTRRGSSLKTRVDVEAFRKGRALPIELLQPELASKVHHLFLRGDHDVAVFQAFKEVEVAVRKAGHYSDGLVGRDLMQKAFHPDDGPLRNSSLVKPEREAEMFLFAGAIGHAKNPTSHREVNISQTEAARLIVFASHLLDIVEQRAPA